MNIACGSFHNLLVVNANVDEFQQFEAMQHEIVSTCDANIMTRHDTECHAGHHVMRC